MGKGIEEKEMKTEMPVKIVIDACKKARANPNNPKNPCPMYHHSNCCQEECGIPKFMAWLMSDVADPADVDEYD